MGNAPEIPSDWTKTERWVWERVAAGELADLNARAGLTEPLDPREADGWGDDRRLGIRFLQTILTEDSFVAATPFGGVRILGALIDGNEPLNLEHARLRHLFWLEHARVLVDVKARNLRVDGGLSFESSYVAGGIALNNTRIEENLSLAFGAFKGRIGLNGATVHGSAFFSGGATFGGEVDLVSADIGGTLSMTGATFEQKVTLDGATVKGSAFLRSNKEFAAQFDGEVDLNVASIGATLDISGATFSGEVDLTGCTIGGEFRLGSSQHEASRWGDGASLILRNTHAGALQDWWQGANDNAWPGTLRLEGFTYDRIGGLRGEGEEANMLSRPAEDFIAWLGRDPGFSPQPYEQLARLFRQAGEPGKAADILYEARERRRRIAGAKTDAYGRPKNRNVVEWLGLGLLRTTIGYGLGNRYFRALLWVAGLTVLGALVVALAGIPGSASWAKLLFASLDQLLPIITLDKAHDALIFGDPAAKPDPIAPQPYGVLVYFYVHKIFGWVLGSFIVAGLAGLTQRN